MAKYQYFHNALYLKNKLSSSRPKTKLRINEQDKIEKLEAIAHRALAFKHYDPGFSIDKWQRDRFHSPHGIHRSDYKTFR
ncbi:39S ribosomal protein L54-like [Tropilaelaps mercedesae]|uniref:39S ribosomal protein L54-like n=1 Tax=Tropilaelaps mercedesae TaxID=418985 RepID=A0A1V9XF50_9ACAR|nr:39S ribosomal protein L54-like [Tropilaelaps mercedesae]